MKGVQFVVDEQGNKNAVLIDLSQWGELWEDICDVMVSQARRDEAQVLWEELKAEIGADEHRKEGQFDAPCRDICPVRR